MTINTMAELRDMHYDCYFQIEQDIAALGIRELAKRVQRRLMLADNWSTAVIYGEAKPVD